MKKIENLLGDGIGSIELINHMGSDIDIVNAARVSFGKRKDLMDEKDEILLKYLADHGHTTPFEHTSMTFHIICPLFVRSQWHRHRTWSYNEISRRYTAEDLKFFVPKKWRLQDKKRNLQGSDGYLEKTLSDFLTQDVRDHIKNSLKIFYRMKDQDIANEMARMVLPQNLYTEYYGTVNLHNAAKFLSLRMDEHAQWEIRQYANAMAELIKPIFPVASKVLVNKGN